MTEKKSTAAIFKDVAVHLKESHPRLLSLKEDPARLVDLYHVEQRFNAFRGTFSFFKAQPGYSEVVTLTKYLEDVANTCRESKAKKISKPHFELCYRSVVLALKYFHCMREEKNITDDMKAEFTKLKDSRSAMRELIGKKHVDQTTVDNLMDQLSSVDS